MICWHRQNVSCLQIVSVHHPGDITAMFAPDLHFLTYTPLFWVSKRGSPSKNFAPRNILGLRNPHRARRRGAVPYRRRGSWGGPPVAGGGAVADPAGWRQRPGRAEGRQQGGEAEKEGGRGIDKASSSLAYGYTAKSICRSGKESDPSGSGPRWAGFGPFGGRGWC